MIKPCLVLLASLASADALRANAQSRAAHKVMMLRGGQVAAAPPSALALPPAGYEGAVAAGTKKANMPASKIFALGILSGCHIGFGAYLMLTVGAACPGLVSTNPGLQKIILGAFGLMMTLVTGAELFTGNTALVTAAALEGEADA